MILKFPLKNRFSLLLLLVAGAVAVHGCKTTSKTTETTGTDMANQVTYTKDIRPIMVNSCTPCHFPEHGQKKLLDTYASTKGDFEDILRRVQLPASDNEYMPFRGKKAALTPEQIELFKKWREQGMKQ